jgi:hypothetical protein
MDLFTGEFLSRPRNQGNGGERLGTFVVRNPDLTPFVLRMELPNGGVMRSDRSPGAIAVRDFRLVYRNAGGTRFQKDISVGWRDAISVFKVVFSEVSNDLFDYYEMELWATPADADINRAGGGTYREAAHFSIRVLE